MPVPAEREHVGGAVRVHVHGHACKIERPPAFGGPLRVMSTSDHCAAQLKVVPLNPSVPPQSVSAVQPQVPSALQTSPPCWPVHSAFDAQSHRPLPVLQTDGAVPAAPHCVSKVQPHVCVAV